MQMDAIMGYYISSKPEPPRNDVNWNVWGNVPGGELWQVVAVSLNINPENMLTGVAFDRSSESLSKYCFPKDFKDRLDVAVARIGHDLQATVPSRPSRLPWDHSYVRMDAFVKLAETLNWELPVEFPRPTPQQEPTPAQSAWPWGGYQTDLLKHLAAAVQEFWTKYDPAKPTTAPTNAKVIDWLKRRGVRDRTAEEMTKIIRADKAPRGPRPRGDN
jgi:hypothetical protein